MSRSWILLLPALPLAGACGSPPPRADTAGAAARKVMDEATARYSECVEREAAAVAVEGQAAGAVAQRVMAACRPDRVVLIEKVEAFRAIGYPTETPERRRAVAEASVAAIETTLRQQAVTAIISRQMGMAPAAGATSAPAGSAAGAPAAPAPAPGAR
jgi:hypothetical protein